ncbi:MAG: CvpA family protein [Candidatus Omnitrophica bacterium]|nr:CvpA family protein [Candidatus Omnitrophota bacterium]
MAGIACVIGYIRGRSKGIFLTLYKILAVLAGIFVFYRLGRFFELIAGKSSHSLAYGLGFVSVILIVVLISRLALVFMHNFLDAKPNTGIYEMIAGAIGFLYGLIWVSVLSKSLCYLNFWGIREAIAGSFTYKFILPVSGRIYESIVGILRIITPGGA